ncbi:hypothetical protein PRIPAC_84021, partial [Pristionchus pacificus]|uniref:Uncharacterized protein n=1 Tax=Pristionchus pacificus TaxID=54126 RepID=A0A2A6BTY7_PRIPA
MIAIVVEHKTDHVVCGFLGAEIDWTVCAKAVQESGQLPPHPQSVIRRSTSRSSTNCSARRLDCDKKCTETEECSSLVVDRKTDHVVCVFLGKQVPATVCIKPTEEYKKMECAEPDGRIVGCFGPAGLDTCRSQLTGPSRLASGGAGLADLDGPV